MVATKSFILHLFLLIAVVLPSSSSSSSFVDAKENIGVWNQQGFDWKHAYASTAVGPTSNGTFHALYSGSNANLTVGPLLSVTGDLIFGTESGHNSTIIAIDSTTGDFSWSFSFSSNRSFISCMVL